VSPESLDTINFDEAVPDMAKFLGVKSTHISTQERIDALRAARREAEQAQQEMEMAQAALGSYGPTAKAAEEGSPAGELMAAAKGA
ncbi:MAG TPA: hypothetical protein VMY35_17265, partial [Phycisphaerae bacterium]|nr:hypothetical protein [Phycisphaerae bacterium]